MTRPEISFFICKTSTQIKDATISGLISANKIVKFFKNTPTYICIPTFHLESLYIKLFLDVSFDNLQNDGSQGVFLVFLSDKFNWISTKLKHFAHSTLAAETMALSDGCDMSFISHSVTCQRNDISQML